MEALLFEQWREQNAGTEYPFRLGASLAGDDGETLKGIFADAVVYPRGVTEAAYLSRVEIRGGGATFHVGDPAVPYRCKGDCSFLSPTLPIKLLDADGVPSGVLVPASPEEFLRLQSWGSGDHLFRPAASPFVAAAIHTIDAPGLAGIRVNGELVTGEVWLVGRTGVTLEVDGQNIIVHAVGDPLFRRTLCEPQSLFRPVRPIRQIRFTDGETEFTCAPDEFGNIRIHVANNADLNTALRIVNSPTGPTIEVVGG